MQKRNWSMTSMTCGWLLCLMAMCEMSVYGFLSAHLSSRQRWMMPSSSLLQFSSSEENNREYSAFTHNMRRTCIHQFLTQRSIQSFMFLLTQIRDPHTANWIENMANATNLLEFHGTGAFNLTRYPDWDSIFLDMMERPKSKIILQAKRRGRGHGGWSKNNPYLKVRPIHIISNQYYTILYYTILVHSFILVSLLLLLLENVWNGNDRRDL